MVALLNIMILLDEFVFGFSSSTIPLITFNELSIFNVLVSKSISLHLKADISPLRAPLSKARTINA